MVKEKIITLRHLRRWRRHLPAGKKVVFTCGGFDIIHLGHIRYLQAARAAGDLLVVGVTADSSERAEKGVYFPLVDVKMRAEIVAYLRGVDFVLAGVDKRNLLPVLRVLRPNVFFTVKRDWEKGVRRAAEAELVEGYGGRVVRTDYLKPFLSSPDLVKKLAQRRIREIMDKYLMEETNRPLFSSGEEVGG